MGILCIDVGGTYIKAAVADSSGRLTRLARAATPKDEYEPFMDALESFYRQAQMLPDGAPIEGIAMSLPGILDAERGFMKTGGSLSFVRDFDMAAAISERCDGLPVSIDNDGKCAARAELGSGVLKDCDNALIVLIGTGIGGAVILDRQVLRGDHLFAGELSFLLADAGAEDPLDRFWGHRGNGKRVALLYSRRAESAPDDLVTEEVFRRMEAGDPLAREVIEAYCADLSVLLCNLQCVTDPQIIAIGGGISEQPRFLPVLKEQLARLQASGLPGMPAVRVESCHYQNDANLIGALGWFAQRFPGLTDGGRPMAGAM